MTVKMSENMLITRVKTNLCTKLVLLDTNINTKTITKQKNNFTTKQNYSKFNLTGTYTNV